MHGMSILVECFFRASVANILELIGINFKLRHHPFLWPYAQQHCDLYFLFISEHSLHREKTTPEVILIRRRMLLLYSSQPMSGPAGSDILMKLAVRSEASDPRQSIMFVSFSVGTTSFNLDSFCM